MDQTIMEKALSTAGFAVLALDEADRVIDISLPAARLLGRDPGDLIDHPVAGFPPVALIRSMAGEQTAPISPGASIEVMVHDKAGHPIPVAASAVAWTTPDGRKLLTVFIRDIAQERKAARRSGRPLSGWTAASGISLIGVGGEKPVQLGSDRLCDQLARQIRRRVGRKSLWRAKRDNRIFRHVAWPFLCENCGASTTP